MSVLLSAVYQVYKLAGYPLLLRTPCSLPVQVLLTPVHLGIVLEYAAGGDMFQHVKRSGGLEEADARWFYQQLMIALDYMHSKSWLQSYAAPSHCFCLPQDQLTSVLATAHEHVSC